MGRVMKEKIYSFLYALLFALGNDGRSEWLCR